MSEAEPLIDKDAAASTRRRVAFGLALGLAFAVGAIAAVGDGPTCLPAWRQIGIVAAATPRRIARESCHVDRSRVGTGFFAGEP